MDIPLIGSGLPDIRGISEEELKNGPRDELLVCADCETIEHIPGFDGPPEYNQARLARLRGHVVDLADGTGRSHAIAFTTVNAKLWAENDEFRKYVVNAISDAQKTGEVGLGSGLYDLRSTFAEDALRCWRVEHNRTENCQDYRSDKKRLVPPTRGERKELGLETRAKNIYTTSYLCDYCPYASVVAQRKNHAKGYY